MSSVVPSFAKHELDEVFRQTPIREVAFEIRFAPRFRVSAELWKLQDQLVSHYPEAAIESLLQSNGTTFNLNVFQNRSSARVIKVSQQNFALAFTKYSRFEDFKDEVINRTDQFCSIFGLSMLDRVGLRYVNHIGIPGDSPTNLLTYVKPFFDFDRLSIDSVQQFASEIEMRHKEHWVTVRSVLLTERVQTYVLDIDCHSSQTHQASEIKQLLDQYHDSAQHIFLDHITEAYKNTMRGKQ